tara:strand:+ start:828 stop:1232 length:405 start_codon:yes stop_codon:yes gene_type:complete
MIFNKISKKNLKINIIPLIDIIFLMLIFFMLATNFNENKQIDFNIDGTIKKISSENRVLQINLNKNKFVIHGEIIEKKSLEKKILKHWESKKYDQIVILNDQETTLETLIFSIDLLKKNNIKKVNFADDPRNKK